MTIGADVFSGEIGVTERVIEVHRGDYRTFFSRHYPPLVGLLTALTGDRAVAEELAQEAMLRAHLRWNRVHRLDDPGAWVRHVGINLARNAFARRRTERRLVDRLGGLPQRDVAPPDASTGDFWAVVRTLPSRQATAVTLHYLEDRSVAEVAEIMGCATGTAKAHLHKGRSRLARLLDLEVDA